MNDVRLEVPLSTLELPKTGYKVVLYEYLTIGQSREFQKIALSKGEYNVEEKKMNKVPVDAFLEMQDKAAEFLIKEVIAKDGATQPFTKEWLYDLPQEDGNLLYATITEKAWPQQKEEERKN